MTTGTRERAADGSVTAWHEVPVAGDTVERLLTEIFEEHWAEIYAGPIVEGAAGYLTVDLGAWHFHLCVGEHRGAPSAEQARVRRAARAAFFHTDGGSCVPGSWGLPVRRVLALGALAVAVVSPAFAAEDAIDPDRPDLTDSAKTVGAGRVQVETGVLTERTSLAPQGDDRDRRDARRLAVETVIRIGVLDSLELRVEGEPWVRLRGPVDDSGHGDVRLSAKWRFLEAPEGAWWPSLGLLPSVTLPVTEEPIGSGRTDAALLLLASFELPWRLDLDVNAGMAAIGQTRPGGYLLQALTSASLSRDVGGGASVFGEMFYASREERDGRDQVGVDAGVVWRLTRWLALDAAAGTFLAGQAPDWFVRVGGTVRFGR